MLFFRENVKYVEFDANIRKDPEKIVYYFHLLFRMSEMCVKSTKIFKKIQGKYLTKHDGFGIIPLLRKNGVWLSLVERLVRDQEAAGSNPVTPTKKPTSTAVLVGFCL